MQYFQSNKNVNARRKPTSEKWVTVDYSTASHVCMNADVITNPESRCKCIMVFHAYLTLFLPSPLSSDLQCLHIPLQQPQSNTSPMTDNGFQKAEHLLYAIFAPYFLVQLCIGESAGGNRPYKHKD